MLKTVTKRHHFIALLTGVIRNGHIQRFRLTSQFFGLFLGHDNIVRTLIELGAQVDAEDKNKRTPLHHAAALGKSITHHHKIFLSL